MNRTNDSNQQPHARPLPEENLAGGQTKAIPVIEEELQVGKKVVETGRVKISKKVHEEEVTVDVPIVWEEVDVERVEVNHYVETPPPPVRFEGEKMIIPVLREVVVVEKRLVLVEELHVTRRKVQTQTPQQVTLRREEIIVERDNPDSDAENPNRI